MQQYIFFANGVLVRNAHGLYYSVENGTIFILNFLHVLILMHILHT